MTTLNDIKTKSLEYLMKIKPKISQDYYDEDGHCGYRLWTEILQFWEKFSTNSDFDFLVSGKYDGELDLDGGGDYIIIRSGITKMCYDYMVNTLGWSIEDYRGIMHNSTEMSDNIMWLYLEDRKNSEEIIKNNPDPKLEFIPSLVKYDKSLREFLITQDSLEFVGNSRVDESPIYKIKSLGTWIPSGYSVIMPIEHHLPQDQYSIG
jgi:hypothetical protein